MKKLFYAGLAGLVVFEILKVYFIMPLPGSQGIESLEAAAIITACLCVAITAWLQWEGWRNRAQRIE